MCVYEPKHFVSPLGDSTKLGISCMCHSPTALDISLFVFSRFSKSLYGGNCEWQGKGMNERIPKRRLSCHRPQVGKLAFQNLLSTSGIEHAESSVCSLTTFGI